MNYKNIQILNRRLFFSVNDAADIFGITHESAWVLCSRYVKQGIFIRLKNNLYVTDIKWNMLSQTDIYKISNFIQSPSYISFLTALSYYGVSTQVQRNFFECASLKRTKLIVTKDTTFCYYKIKRELYFDFNRNYEFFIASPEKALADSLYLLSMGRYSLDIDALDINKLDKKRFWKIIKSYPEKTMELSKNILT